MNRLVVLLDSGLLKYSSRAVAKRRLGFSYDDPDIEFAKHSGALPAIYDVLAVSLRSKLGNLERALGKIDRCICCLDIGDSWRCNVQKTIIPGTEQASSISYKGHRRTDDPEQLAALAILNKHYKTALDFACNNSGIEQVGKFSLEADDFMILLSQQYAKQGNTVIILAKDADITQAVCSFENGGRVICMQPMRDKPMRIVVDHATAKAGEATDIFNMSKLSPNLTQFIANAAIVAPQYMLFEKVMNGDLSDDISPVMCRVSNGRSYKPTSKHFAAVYEHFSASNAEGYFTIDNMYNRDDIMTILRMMHQMLFKQCFDDLPIEWQKFYYDKFIENRKMVVCNKAELGDRYNEVLQCAAEQLHGIVPQIAFPTWDVIQRLSMDI